MSDTYCKFCDRLIEPKFHKNSKDCEENSASKMNCEHLHFYCRCGHDECIDIKDLEKE